ncbi:hypothetical protein NECAME_02029 [Necator americanus]|uniref:Uncharacterized protein n=1 Tax=Necator americanus TaxID=51031 RepID=W2TMT0_NECAM|nr:hypothetical protein NECAME_02029 [Necator americanus]ETN82292.1 hypothetical protein NECAME_02029 [Necator americanus]
MPFHAHLYTNTFFKFHRSTTLPRNAATTLRIHVAIKEVVAGGVVHVPKEQPAEHIWALEKPGDYLEHSRAAVMALIADQKRPCCCHETIQVTDVLFLLCKDCLIKS